MNEPELLPAYDLSNSEHIAALFDWFGANHSLSLLSKFWEMVKEFDDQNYQDCFRARYVGFCWDNFSNDEDKINHIINQSDTPTSDYQNMIGCCGSVDRYILIDDKVWLIGCNFGH